MLLGLLIMSSCAQKNGGLLVLGSLGCLGASAVSGTRGAWVALPLLLILIAWQAMTSAKPLKNTALMALVLAGVTAASWPLLQERIHKGQQDLSLNQPQQQQPSNATTTTSSSEDLNTSMGYRIAMWTIATKMIEDKPWLGQGSSVFPEQMQPWADKLGLNARFPDGGFQNPHNQFLGWAAVHGIPIALLLLSGVWIVPCVQVKKARRGCSDKTNVLRLEWRSLLLLVGMTALFGLTESVLERQRGAAWFMVWVCLLAGSAIYRATSAPSTGGGTS